jgi:hypothetical protein
VYVAERKYKIDDKWYEIGYFICHYQRKHINKPGYTIKVVDRRYDDDAYDTVITPHDKIYNLEGIKPEWAVAPNFNIFVTANNKLMFLSYFTLYFGRIEKTGEEFKFHLENSIKLLKAFNMKGNCTDTLFKFLSYEDNSQLNLAVIALSIVRRSGPYYTIILDPAILVWELSNPENCYVDNQLHKELKNLFDNIQLKWSPTTNVTLEHPDQLIISLSSLSTDKETGIKEIRCRYNLGYRIISGMEFLKQQD